MRSWWTRQLLLKGTSKIMHAASTGSSKEHGKTYFISVTNPYSKKNIASSVRCKIGSDQSNNDFMTNYLSELAEKVNRGGVVGVGLLWLQRQEFFSSGLHVQPARGLRR